MKNNYIVHYYNSAWQNDYADWLYLGGGGTDKTVSWMQANYASVSGNIYNYCNPKFIDPSAGDFHIHSGSCLIDAGRHLTTTNGSGSSSTTLVVNDALFFWSGDILKVGSVTTTVSSIVYSTNTITLASPISWSNGDNVDLAYNGTAPDIGAFEYVSGSPPSPPRNLRLLP